MYATDARTGAARFDLIGWLGYYWLVTPGVSGSVRPLIRHKDETVQPDVILRILETHTGQCRVRTDRYLEGGPELIAEISNTTTDEDLGAKRDLYRRFGVQEYIVWRVLEQTVDWFTLRDGYYFPLERDTYGVIRSEIFPGLWLAPSTLMFGNSAKFLEVAQLGHGSPEHYAFIADLQRQASE